MRAVMLAVVRAVTRAVVLVLRVKHKPRSVNDRHRPRLLARLFIKPREVRPVGEKVYLFISLYHVGEV